MNYFYVYYEVDDDEVATVLSLENYNGDEECSWLQLDRQQPKCK